MLKAEGLTKNFGRRVAVRDVSFEVPGGLVTGFLGANGAGKTTAMRLMLGLARGGGKTSYFGRPLSEWRCPARVVGASLGGVAGNRRHRVLEHLRMVAAGIGLPGTSAWSALERVGLTDVTTMRIAGLSLGMAQRVGLAQAILGDPPAYLLDEPANGLDPHAIRWLRGFLRSLAQDGRAVFVSSHLLAEMELLADRIIVLGKGRVLAEVSVGEVTRRSRTIVETGDPPRLERLAFERGGQVVPHCDGRVAITGLDRRQVGELAVEHGIPIYWLSSETATLEDFYLDVAEEEFSLP